MKCPICGKDLELQNKQTGTNENGEPVFNEYAICRSCRKQWNLDKQRAKKIAARKAAAEKAAAEKTSKSDNTATEHPAKPVMPAKPSPRQEKTTDSDIKKPKTVSDKTRVSRKKPAKEAVGDASSSKPVRSSKGTADSVNSPVRKSVKKRSADNSSEAQDEKRYSNIPSEKVRNKHEKAVRKNYEDMLATGTVGKPSRKKKSKQDDDTKNIPRNVDGKHAANVKTSAKKTEVDDDYDDDYYDDVPRFRAMRIILGIISVVGFGFFIYRGFMTGLAGTTEGIEDASGMIYIIVALCMLVSALIYFIMQKANTVFAFLLPMLFYLGGGVFAFMKKGDDMQLLIAAVACAALALISLILAVASRGGYDYDDEDDDYDDAFDDEYDD